MKRLYVDMDGVLCDFIKAFEEQFIAGKVEFPQSQCRFYENLEQIEDAHSCMRSLNELFDVWILTANPHNPAGFTEKRIWLEENFGEYGLHKKLILSPDKSLLKGDFLVDDNSSGKGQDLFEGELVLFGGEEYPNWLKVSSYLYTRLNK
jgi:5'-nucleotidase